MSESILEFYQEYVKKLSSPASMESFGSKLLTSGLGLAGEAGECADLVKKTMFHGAEFDRDKYIKELSDICWYLAFSANMLDMSIEDIVKKNIEKLDARYKTGKFTVEEFKLKEAAKNE